MSIRDEAFGRCDGREVAVRSMRTPMTRLAEHADNPIPQEKLSLWLDEGNERISWDDFQEVLAGLGEVFTHSELMDLGADGVRRSPYNVSTAMGRWLMTLDDVYRLVTTPRTPVDFSCLKAVITSEEKAIHVSVVCVDGYSLPNPAFAWILLGAARELARAFGHVGDTRTWTSHNTITLEVERHAPSGLLSPLHRWFSNAVLSFVQMRHIGRVYTELAVRTRYLELADEIHGGVLEREREQRRRLDEYLAEVDDVVAEYDRFNRPLYISPNAERVLGYPIALLEEQSFAVLVPREKLDWFYALTARIQFEDVSGVHQTEVALASGEPQGAVLKFHRIPLGNGAFNWRVVLRLQATRSDQPSAVARVPMHQVNGAKSVASVELDASSQFDFSPRKIVLIIDDDARVRSVVRTAVERLGFLPYEAESGEVALAMLNEEGLRPDAMVLDISLPGTNGDTVFARVRKWLNVPVVFLTASPEVVPLDLANTVTIAKPFRVSDLGECLVQLMARARVHKA